MKTGPKPVDPAVRFERFCRPDPSGCRLWAGAITDNGYGKFGKVYAHRFAYESERGPIPAGMQIDHLCRVRSCVNTDHMEVVTNRENTMRGRAPERLRERRRQQTHCKAGHPLSGNNVRLKHVAGVVWRRCRTCESAWNLLGRQRRQA